MKKAFSARLAGFDFENDRALEGLGDVSVLVNGLDLNLERLAGLVLLRAIEN
jgi:hypothetical protein